MANQKTIVREKAISGVGLHTGQEVHVSLRPAPPDTGVVFVRVDLPGEPRVRARIENITLKPRRTALAEGEAEVQTIEHLLAVVSVLDIQNLEVRLDASARLAKLLLAKGDEQGAMDLVKKSIDGVRRESFYLSNLHSVRGEILEHRSRRLDKAGDKESARLSAREAMDAFEQSIAINKRLQQQLLQGENR